MSIFRFRAAPSFPFYATPSPSFFHCFGWSPPAGNCAVVSVGDVLCGIHCISFHIHDNIDFGLCSFTPPRVFPCHQIASFHRSRPYRSFCTLVKQVKGHPGLSPPAAAGLICRFTCVYSLFESPCGGVYCTPEKRTRSAYASPVPRTAHSTPRRRNHLHFSRRVRSSLPLDFVPSAFHRIPIDKKTP